MTPPVGPRSAALELPALVSGTVRHRRVRPVRHHLGFRTYLWLVDLDRLPRDSWLASFRAADHLGPDPSESLKSKLTRFAQARGAAAMPGDRVVMLTGARAWGHTFNPLTTYWCLARDGSVRWAVLEIHNTYGERHAHLVRLDAGGRAEVSKAFYVSPFFTVAGSYQIRLRLDTERVGVRIALRQNGRIVFTAGFDGRPLPASRGARLRAAVRTPFVMHQTSVRIRLHGIRLWLRGLPVVPRPVHPPPGGLS